MDVEDFLRHAEFSYNRDVGTTAHYRGEEYEIAPDGPDHVRIVGHDGETLGRIAFVDGKFEVAQ